ncbi:hypothetical protein [Novosphingobium terrae]|uniref:hypothetical protein n=1 Tax=Novosphingobium terrae TaxID=2726189 RepID=UPI00197FB349|nr:hypothetical protein [Novosphingobium terrae]
MPGQNPPDQNRPDLYAPDQPLTREETQRAPREPASGGALRWLSDRIPMPMAAPETERLRRMRHTIIGICLALALTVLEWEPLLKLGGCYAFVALQALVLALVLLTLIWARAKWRADQAWLYRDQGEGE